MRAHTDLILLRDGLRTLTETPYFNSNLSKFLSSLHDVISHVLESNPPLPSVIVEQVSGIAWLCHSYLQGSTSKDIPYEVSYCLEKAIVDWLPSGGIVTTTLTDDKNYHLRPADPWSAIEKAVPAYSGASTRMPLVMIGLPRLYKHKPLYCIPLYHELGHFVDNALGVTQSIILKLLTSAAIQPDQKSIDIATNYFKEYFADLFASSYVGEANLAVLNTIAPNAQDSFTHPSTQKRGDVVNAFLGGGAHPVLDLVQEACRQQAGRDLRLCFTKPSIQGAFDDVRPAELRTTAEVHGLFPVAWDYLTDALDTKRPDWCKVSGFDVSRIEAVVNDLVEKSIRNLSVVEKWNNAAPH